MEKEARIMGNAEISMHFHDFLNGEGGAGNPESLKMIRFPLIFIISLMEKEVWETQNH